MTFPDHGDGAAGTSTGTGETTSSVSAASAGGAPASTSTSAGPTSGGGDGGGAASGGGAEGGGGNATRTCDEPVDCHDESSCTTDSCVDGRCENVPVADGTLADDDPTDCIDIVCQRGRETPTPDDSEDPPDTSPPCNVTVCQDGRPVQVLADVGTSCGAPPLECDGRGGCAGCDGEPANECGNPTACSDPSCDVAQALCDPSFSSQDPDDPTDGDCQALDCPGDQADPNVVADDTDTPGDLACSDRGCSDGSIIAPVRAEGLACLGGASGVCDGLGTGPGSCKTCRNTVAGAGTDPGCAAAAPICDEAAAAGDGACVECLDDAAAGGQDTGCPDATPFCDEGGSGCVECTIDAHCVNSPNGLECIRNGGTACGCDNGIDCQGPDAAGPTCTAGVCQ